ncbi:MAG: KAP family NTPase [Motiliproteus sp.]|nr:KAP family NTPase [Motiliproteus sp.]MCW9053234.1 KAP family NTPase [Motiliproteus sp.]
MNTEVTTQPNPQSIPLRLTEPQFEKGVWPCPEDRLERHKEIENLSPVLLNAQAPLVFAIDAPWGGGKTTFIKLWQHFLEHKENKVSLYLNAWESDFAEDPLLPMLAVLDDWLSTFDPESTAGKYWSKTKKLAPRLIRTGLSTAAKVATFGALDADAAIERVAADAAGGITGDVIDAFKAKQSALNQFKKQLNKALDGLPEGQQNLIIFVDELDRCKPTYAIEVLERIKHLFDIDRLVFVLAINRDQLSKSLQGVYGPSFDGLHYLKRFIDLDYHLRVPDIDAYIEAKIDQPDIREYFQTRNSEREDNQFCASILKWLTKRFSYTPRDIDQLIIRLRLIFRSIPKDHYLDIAILTPLLVLRQQDSGLYQRYVDDISVVNEVAEFLLNGRIGEVEVDRPMGAVIGCLIAAGMDRYTEVSIEPLIEPWRTWFEALPEQDERIHEIRTLLSIVQDSGEYRRRNGVRSLAFKRIELVNQIDVSA